MKLSLKNDEKLLFGYFHSSHFTLKCLNTKFSCIFWYAFFLLISIDEYRFWWLPRTNLSNLEIEIFKSKIFLFSIYLVYELPHLLSRPSPFYFRITMRQDTRVLLMIPLVCMKIQCPQTQLIVVSFIIYTLQELLAVILKVENFLKNYKLSDFLIK